MGEITRTHFIDSEITKTEDFQLAADSAFDTVSDLFSQWFADITHDVIVSGLEVQQETTPSMNVLIKAGFGYRKNAEEICFLSSDLSVSITAADASNDRIDTVECKLKKTDLDAQTRKFKDPTTGNESYSSVYTKYKLSAEIKVVTGTAGTSVAPDVDSGYMKLAEVKVPYGVTTIVASNIKNSSADYDGQINSGWTADTAVTFRLGSVNEIKETLLTHTANTQPHGASASALASRLMWRDANGRSQVLAPSADSDIARKVDVDNSYGSIINDDLTIAGTKTFSETIQGDISGNAATATLADTVKGGVESAERLTTARTIGGVSFDGSANINLPGVNISGNQSTTGNAATATTAASCSGNAATSSSCSGNAATATTAASCSGNAATSSSCTGNAATATSTRLCKAYSPGETYPAGYYIDLGSIGGSINNLIVLVSGTVPDFHWYLRYN